MLDIFKKIAAAHGVAGNENDTAGVIAELMSQYTDDISIDNLGNLIAVRKGNGENKQRIMLCAHMDEIGFMVTFIEKNGFIRIAPIGGINYTAVSYTRVRSENGVRGIIIPEAKVKPADYRAENFVIDIGAKSEKEASRRVKIGDTFRFDNDLVKLMGRRVFGHPADDRIGCAVLVDIARQLDGADIKDDVYFVFSVQEEVGCRGSKTASYAIEPDISLAFDVTATGDTPSATPMKCELSSGAAIKIKDSSVICDPTLVDELIAVAKDKKIKYQLEVLLYGGTDTSSMQMAKAGSRAGAISIPTRYIHSPNEMLDMDDAQACADLAAEFIKGLS